MSLPAFRLFSIAAIALTLSACVVSPYPYRTVYGAPGYGAPAYGTPAYGTPAYGGQGNDGSVVVVDVAPPAPYVEVVPVMPYAGAVWLGGYWGWSGGRHVWTGGRWDHPRAGYRYQPHAWVPVGGRWQLHGGAWVRG